MNLTIEHVQDIHYRLTDRKIRFPTEPEDQRLAVVLLNYGDHLTEVRCVNRDHAWRGTKEEAGQSIGGLPICPHGHPLVESRTHLRLGLVEETL